MLTFCANGAIALARPVVVSIRSCWTMYVSSLRISRMRELIPLPSLCLVLSCLIAAGKLLPGKMKIYLHKAMLEGTQDVVQFCIVVHLAAGCCADCRGKKVELLATSSLFCVGSISRETKKQEAHSCHNCHARDCEWKKVCLEDHSLHQQVNSTERSSSFDSAA